MQLVTLADLAEAFQITDAEAEALRCRHRWPHVKMGRKNVRFTPEQVELIIKLHTVSAASEGPVRLTRRSEAHLRRRD